MRKWDNSEEGSEMEVDDEERKVEIEGNSVVLDSDEEMKGSDEIEKSKNEVENAIEVDKNHLGKSTKKDAPVTENPFLDSFYNLSAPNSKERSRAAQVMLFHCLLGPNANPKDAAYAFRRLLNGICSGRASARQGNAAALASFLKIAFQLNKMEEIRDEAENNSGNYPGSPYSYVRDRLLSATDPHRMAGKKSGSEERDYHFGRLFGILGIVRSSILLLEGDTEKMKEVASSLVLDLVELFWHRRWMREPAAHGITAILNLFFGSNRTASQKIGRHIVKKVIIPKVLIISQDERTEESDFETIVRKYCPEQIGIGTFIQSLSHSKKLPFPLHQPIISTKTLPWIGQALSETSSIVQPRTHFVWDTLWSYLTEKFEETKTTENRMDSAPMSSKYVIRNTIPIGEDRAIDVIDAIMKVVIEGKLLQIEQGDCSSKSTHERKSLAMCVVRNLSGVPFVSSISGPTQIIIDCGATKSIVLRKDIIRYLFLDIIKAGKKKEDTSHPLKPLALEVLGSMVKCSVQSGDINRQLVCATALTNCHPRFDLLTQTSTISDLLLLSRENVPIEVKFEFWEKYFAHLEQRFLEECCASEGPYHAARDYVELTYTSAKQILHGSNEDEVDHGIEIMECKKKVVKRIVGLFMSTAFFDCSSLTKATKSRGEKLPLSPIQHVIDSAQKVKAKLQNGQKIPYSLRMMISARFFSLVSEFENFVSHDSKNEDNLKAVNDSITLAVLVEIYEFWSELESQKAKRFASVNDSTKNECSPALVIKNLRSKAFALEKNLDSNEPDDFYESKKRCVNGLTVLALTLHLHRLSCGSDDEIDDNPDADEEEDEENICDVLEQIQDVATDFLSADKLDCNPLLGLSEICANVLSSPLGSGDIGRGAAPKLITKSIKYAWLGGLKLASTIATREKTLLDDTVVRLLMDAIGASNTDENIEDDDSEIEDDGSEMSDNESHGESDNNMIFSKASKVFDDPEDIGNDEKTTSGKEDDDSDIELDPSKLQTILEHDDLDDVDDIVLEHHEGADAALAKLIKLKQDARKAGQEAREKIETSNQLRCTMLIETVLERPSLCKRLYQSNMILKMVVPLLQCRKTVGIAAQRVGRKSSTGDKNALLHRLNVLIKRRLFSIRLKSMPLSSPVDMKVATNVLQCIMKEAKISKDKDYLSCCSYSLIFLLRMMPSCPELVVLVSTEYGDLIKNWSGKRNNGADILEDLILHMPSLAQASLFGAISRATQEAKGSYLKNEAYRLFTLLFSKSPNFEGQSEMEKVAQAKIHKSQYDLLDKISRTLKCGDTKPKLAKATLLAFEKLLWFVSSPASSETIDLIMSIKILINGLREDHPGLNVFAAKLITQIDIRLNELKKDSAALKVDVERKTESSSSARKSKKKKKR